MRKRANRKGALLIALLCGSAIPAVGLTHWEGFEAADPATPAAVLRFNGAVTRYSASDSGPLPWRALFEGDNDSPGADDHAHMDHSGVAEGTPATPQQ